MKDLTKHLTAAAFGVLAVLAVEYVISARNPDTAELSCTFDAEKSAVPLYAHSSQEVVQTIKFSGQMTGRTKGSETGTDLWHVEGEARFAGKAQQLSGVIFLSSADKVTGIRLSHDRHPPQASDLRIATLNANGVLDQDETRAYAFFEGAASKLDYPFQYRCSINGRIRR